MHLPRAKNGEYQRNWLCGGMNITMSTPGYNATCPGYKCQHQSPKGQGSSKEQRHQCRRQHHTGSTANEALSPHLSMCRSISLSAPQDFANQGKSGTTKWRYEGLSRRMRRQLASSLATELGTTGLAGLVDA